MRFQKILAALSVVFISVALLGCIKSEPLKQAPNVTAAPPIKTTILKPTDMQGVLEKGDIRAFVAWEPYVSKAEAAGQKVLLRSGQIWPHHPCCVLAVSENFLKNNPEAASRLLAAHVEATDFINKNPDEAAKIFADEYQMDLEMVKKAMANVEYTTTIRKEELKTYITELNDFKLINQTDPDGYLLNTIAAVLPANTGQKAKLKVGYLATDLHQLAFFVAQKKGIFDKYGIEVESEGTPSIRGISFPNGAAEMDAFAAGSLDAGYLGAAPAVTKSINLKVPIKMIAQVNNEGSAIVTGKDVMSISDLAGGLVAVPGYGTVQDFLLRMAAGHYQVEKAA